MSGWIADRLKNGAIYVGVSIAFMVGIYALFLKPTTKNINTAPSERFFESSQVHIYPCGKFFTYGKNN